MRRYYFAYHSFCGLIFGFMWAEEKNLPIGGRPNHILDGQKYEITEEEFHGTIAAMEVKHPVKLPSPLKT